MPSNKTTVEVYKWVAEQFIGQQGVSGPFDPVSTSRNFGASALKFHGKIFAMVSSKEEFVVKLPHVRCTELITTHNGKPYDPGHGRLMKEWLVVSLQQKEDWLALAKEALEFAKNN